MSEKCDSRQVGMSAIEDVLWRMGYLRSGEDLRITHTENCDGWQRAECPKCGYERAQVHYGRGVFWCPKVDKSTGEHCLRVAVGREWSVIDEFAELIVKVAGNASVRKYGQWLSALEVTQWCQELLLTYDLDGSLDKWADEVDCDPDRLRAYVFTALRGDVLDCAKAKVRRIRAGGTPDTEFTAGDTRLNLEEDTPDDDNGMLAEYPTLAMYYSGMSTPDIARIERVSEATIRQRIHRETERYKRDHGISV